MAKILNFLRNKKLRFLLLLLLLAGVFRSGYKTFMISGDSMDDTLNNGDVVLVNKKYYNYTIPQRGDLIVCFGDGDVVIKRIIGVPGDEVEIIEGVIIINGDIYIDELTEIPLEDPLAEGYGFYINERAIFFGGGEYWLIGDNRAVSWYGVIREEDIIGLVYEF